MNQNYVYYNELLKIEPYYSKIPYHYWVENERISTKEYVLEKMKTNRFTVEVLLEACKKYPEIFSYWMLGIHLRPYQHYAIDEIYKNNYTAMAWSRRLGKSTITKLVMLKTAIFNELPGEMTGTTWNVILQDQEIANSLYIEPLHEIMEKGDKIVNKNFKGNLGENFFTSKLVTRREKSGKVRSNQISFSIDGAICRINTMPPTSKAIGREGNLIGDEVTKWRNNPKMRDEFKYFDQLIAIMKDNPIYKCIFLTTPEGDQDLFATEIFDPDDRLPNNIFKKIWFAYWARIDKTWLEEMKRTKEKAEYNKRLHMFQQEYEAKFMTISNPYFDYAKHIYANRIDNWKQTHELGTACSLGIDWGGTQKSETVLVIYKWDLKQEGLRKPIYVKHYPVGEDLDKLEPDLLYIKRNFNVKWVVPDNKGGRWMIPRLEQIFGMGRVQPFNFTTDKTTGYELFRQGLNEGLIKLPNYNPLIDQLKNMNEDLKPNTSKGKDDLADGAMLACYPLMKQQENKFRVILWD